MMKIGGVYTMMISLPLDNTTGVESGTDVNTGANRPAWVMKDES